MRVRMTADLKFRGLGFKTAKMPVAKGWVTQAKEKKEVMNQIRIGRPEAPRWTNAVFLLLAAAAPALGVDGAFLWEGRPIELSHSPRLRGARVARG